MTSTTRKSWIFRYKAENGKLKSIGLGSAFAVTLAEAREKAFELRNLRSRGIDPLTHKRKQAAQTSQKTFDDFAREFIESHKSAWTEKHTKLSSKMLSMYASSIIGDIPINKIEVSSILKVLQPLWATKSATAAKLRGLLESVLDLAKVKGSRTGENPAKWRGNLDHILPASTKVAPTQHHDAMPYKDVPAFVRTLRKDGSIAAFALEYLILCASRSKEIVGAQWSEIDFTNEIWTIPPERMKARKEHRIPLSERALGILKQMQEVKTCEYIFPGRKGKLAGTTLIQLLERLGLKGMTVHGFRSSFRDFCGEETTFPREVAEHALAHRAGDATELSYRRGDALEKRRELMKSWANYCERN